MDEGNEPQGGDHRDDEGRMDESMYAEDIDAGFSGIGQRTKVALEGVQSDMPRRNGLDNTQSLTGELGSGKGWLPPADETALSKPSGDEGVGRAVLSAGPALDDNILGEEFCGFIM